LSVENTGYEHSAAALDEAEKGYDMLFVGVEHPLEPSDGDSAGFNPQIEKIVQGFDGRVAIVVAKGKPLDATWQRSLDIL
jgi:hypothetical protein